MRIPWDALRCPSNLDSAPVVFTPTPYYQLERALDAMPTVLYGPSTEDLTEHELACSATGASIFTR